jgi:wyosine [tRNA(Phe)-imidazoG37] synthetase (radical SAM superfamily)
MDPPLEIVEQAVNAHKGMVKQMKGVPGVLPERLAEGMEPRHCALSLVGEPIMYPEINTLVGELHRCAAIEHVRIRARWSLRPTGGSQRDSGVV